MKFGGRVFGISFSFLTFLSFSSSGFIFMFDTSHFFLFGEDSSGHFDLAEEKENQNYDMFSSF